MRTQLSTAQKPRRPEERRATQPRHDAGTGESMSALAIRVHGEYREMPGLHLTVRQAARLFSLAPGLADAAWILRWRCSVRRPRRATALRRRCASESRS